MFRQNLKTRKIDQIDIVPKCSYYQPSIFDEFLFDDGTRCSDITFIFNQTRLDKIISKDNFDAYFSNLFRDNTPNPYEGMSDDEIMQFVKDRRLSNFNDWYNYTRCLVDDCTDLERYKAEIESRKASLRDKEEKFKSLFKKDSQKNSDE